jgi:hypothetical protein
VAKFFFLDSGLFDLSVHKSNGSKIACQSVFCVKNNLTTSANPYIATAQLGSRGQRPEDRGQMSDVGRQPVNTGE